MISDACGRRKPEHPGLTRGILQAKIAIFGLALPAALRISGIV
jgi:hypothetical protein